MSERVARAAAREALVEYLATLDSVQFEKSSEEIADAILASGALVDVREVQAKALEDAADAEYRHGASSGHLVPSIANLLRARAIEIRKGVSGR